LHKKERTQWKPSENSERLVKTKKKAEIGNKLCLENNEKGTTKTGGVRGPGISHLRRRTGGPCSRGERVKKGSRGLGEEGDLVARVRRRKSQRGASLT